MRSHRYLSFLSLTLFPRPLLQLHPYRQPLLTQRYLYRDVALKIPKVPPVDSVPQWNALIKLEWNLTLIIRLCLLNHW